MLVMLRVVFSYLVYVRQADVFLTAGYLNGALLDLVPCASLVIVTLSYFD